MNDARNREASRLKDKFLRETNSYCEFLNYINSLKKPKFIITFDGEVITLHDEPCEMEVYITKKIGELKAYYEQRINQLA